MKYFAFVLALLLLLVGCTTSNPAPTATSVACPPTNVFGVTLNAAMWQRLSSVDLSNSAGTVFRFSAQGTALTVTLVSTGTSSTLEVSADSVTVIPIATDLGDRYVISGPVYFVQCSGVIYYNTERIGEEYETTEPPSGFRA